MNRRGFLSLLLFLLVAGSAKSSSAQTAYAWQHICTPSSTQAWVVMFTVSGSPSTPWTLTIYSPSNASVYSATTMYLSRPTHVVPSSAFSSDTLYRIEVTAPGVTPYVWYQYSWNSARGSNGMQEAVVGGSGATISIGGVTGDVTLHDVNTGTNYTATPSSGVVSFNSLPYDHTFTYTEVGTSYTGHITTPLYKP